jgi:hypothetical protein
MILPLFSRWMPGSGGGNEKGLLREGFVGEDSGVGEAEVLRFADMVEYPVSEDLRGPSQPAGALAVFPRWGWIFGSSNRERHPIFFRRCHPLSVRCEIGLNGN